jgi:hypothetical protein
VPAHLFRDEEGRIARLDAGGAIGLTLARGRSARLDDFDLGPGHWRIRAEASGSIEIEIRDRDASRVLARGVEELALDLPAADATRLDIRLSVGSAATNSHVRGLLLVRDVGEDVGEGVDKEDAATIAP